MGISLLEEIAALSVGKGFVASFGISLLVEFSFCADVRGISLLAERVGLSFREVFVPTFGISLLAESAGFSFAEGGFAESLAIPGGGWMTGSVRTLLRGVGTTFLGGKEPFGGRALEASPPIIDCRLVRENCTEDP